MLRTIASAAACLAAATILTSASASAQVKLPASVTMTAYDTGSSGFNITIAVGKMMKDKYGADVRVLPAGNDVARLQPLRVGRATLSGMGAGVYFAQEGVFEFATRERGPQPVQITLSVIDCNGLSLAAAGDAGVSSLADLKGKRIGFVVGSPALNQNALAVLAYAGLTAKEVKIVECASNNAMWKGIVNNDADAVFGSTISGQSKELQTSPRGIVWLPLPFEDKAGWERMRKVAPYFVEHTATCGSGISPEKPVKMGAYPYPIYTAYGSQPEDEVYLLTKAMIEGYDLYKDNAPGAAGLAVAKQTKNWAVPVHKGAVKALKEAGAWSEAQEKHNADLLKRQDVLRAAWDAYLKSNPAGEGAKFAEGWMAARQAALAKANLPNTFD